jgi:hypothetical protein
VFAIIGLSASDDGDKAKTCGAIAIGINVGTIVFWVVGIVVLIIALVVAI